MDNETFLDKRLDELGLGERFALQSKDLGMRTLRDVLMLSPVALAACPGFSYHWLEKLSAYFIRHKKLHLLQSAGEKLIIDPCGHTLEHGQHLSGGNL